MKSDIFIHLIMQTISSREWVQKVSLETNMEYLSVDRRNIRFVVDM